jgi:hypothetical protein
MNVSTITAAGVTVIMLMLLLFKVANDELDIAPPTSPSVNIIHVPAADQPPLATASNSADRDVSPSVVEQAPVAQTRPIATPLVDPVVKRRPPRPDADIQSYSIPGPPGASSLSLGSPYKLAQRDVDRMKSQIYALAAKKISTARMARFYTTRTSGVFDIPIALELQKNPPQKYRQFYFAFYYQHGMLRQVRRITKDKEELYAKLFYNDRGQPVLLAKYPAGKMAWVHWLEYSSSGYLARKVQFSIIRNLSAGQSGSATISAMNVDLYYPAPGYRTMIEFDITGRMDSGFSVWEKYIYAADGCSSQSVRNPAPQKYTSRTLPFYLVGLKEHGVHSPVPIPNH